MEHKIRYKIVNISDKPTSDLIDRVKSKAGYKTNTKAVHHAFEIYEFILDRLNPLEKSGLTAMLSEGKDVVPYIIDKLKSSKTTLVNTPVNADGTEQPAKAEESTDGTEGTTEGKDIEEPPPEEDGFKGVPTAGQVCIHRFKVPIKTPKKG